MAIYSLSQTPIGRSTHAEGTAGAHIGYISRGGACSAIGAGNMPANSNEAQSWMLEQERADRKNARVVDKIMAALPRELSSEQRYKLVEDYVADITGRRAAYFFAIHESGEDAQNPHAHIVVRDRDFETGQKIIGLSDSKKQWEKRGRGQESATHWIRERWEHHANQALERAGHDLRIDRRSLEVQRDEALQQGDLNRAQALDRKAQIHIGVKAKKLAEKGIRPESKGNYQKIDQGRTREEYNAEIIDLNIEKKIRSRDHTLKTWGLFEKEQAAKERELEKQHRQTRNRLEKQEQETRTYHRIALKRLGEERNNYAQTQIRRKEAAQKQAFERLQTQQSKEAKDLKAEQGRIFARMAAFLDLTGKTTEKQKQATQEQAQRHKTQIETHHKTTAETLAKTRETALKDYETKITDALNRRDEDLNRAQQSKEQNEALIQSQLQERAAEREQARAAVEQVIKERQAKAKGTQTQKKPVRRAPEQDNQPQNGVKQMEKPAHELNHMITDKENNGRNSLERWQDQGFTKLAEHHSQEANQRGVKVSDITAEQAHKARYPDTHLQPTPEPQAQAESRAAEIQTEIESARSGQSQEQSQDRGMEIG